MIPTLIEPILNGAAQLAIGDRNPGQFAEFSPVKRFLQRLGSHTVAFVTGEDVRDAVCGFRAYSRKALLSINPITNYTYTVDTLIQAHKKGLDVSWVPIRPNARTRDSRLITSLLAKVRKSGATILRLFTIYEPFKTFLALAALFFIPALILRGRFAYFYLFVPEHATGHVQSVVIGGVFLVIAVQIGVLGIIGDLLSANRKLIEDGLTRIRRLETMETETVSDVTKINTKIEGGSRITNRKQADKIASVG